MPTAPGRTVLRSLLLCGAFLAAAAVAHAQPVCSIAAPDSIHFDTVTWNRYLPGEFSVSVTVVNAGTQRIDSVVVFPRSNPRFTILSPATVLVAESLAPGDTARCDFLMQVNPRTTSSVDTFVVAVSAKAGARGECRYPIWVEKEYRPVNVLACPPDTIRDLHFVDSLDAYRPDPLLLPLVLENTGDAPSKETQILYIATPGVAPAATQDPILPLGTLTPGTRIERMFALAPVRRDTDTVVTVRFRAQGRGGLGDRIIDTLCAVQVALPAARTPVFALSCDNRVQIVSRDGVYEPNPFDWTVTVRNEGRAHARDVHAVLSLPPGIVPDSGSATDITIGALAVGDARTVTFRLRALPSDEPDTAIVCARVFDAFNRSAACCDTIIRPAALVPRLDGTCLIVPDTIAWNDAAGSYQPATFSARLQLGNTGRLAAEDVSVEIVISDPNIALVSPATSVRSLPQPLAPGENETLEWLLAPQQDPDVRDVRITFIVRARNATELRRECAVHIAATPTLELSCEALLDPADTLHYDPVTLAYLPLRISARVTNTGIASASGLQAVVLLPPGVGLHTGDSAVRRFDELRFDPTATWDVSWLLRPIARRSGSRDTIRVEFRAEGGRVVCERSIFIIGIPPLTVVAMPTNLVQKYGRELRVPVRIDNSAGKDIRRLDLAISWDPALLDLIEVDASTGLLAPPAWDVQSASQAGRVMITAEATGDPLGGEGELLGLRYQVRFGAGDDALRWSYADLRFDTTASSVNTGGVLLRYYHGLAVLSGDCLEPLRATDDFVVGRANPWALRASPNPFNPSTTLQFTLPAAMPVTLRIVDVLGREALRPLDAVPLDAGTHVQRLDAQALAGGLWLAVLDTPRGRSLLRLLLLR